MSTETKMYLDPEPVSLYILQLMKKQSIVKGYSKTSTKVTRFNTRAKFKFNVNTATISKNTNR